MKNLGNIDRVIRLFIGLLFLVFGYFWLGGIWEILIIIIGFILVITSLIGFCPLYKLFRLTTHRQVGHTMNRWGIVATSVVAILILVGGSYASIFITKKRYLEDFNQMNQFYKQALFQTGQQNREQAVSNYDALIKAYAGFKDKYTSYHPYALKGDELFNSDLTKVSQMISSVADQVHSGDLGQAHLALEEIRPVFQDIFKRNGFSMLSVALVDFHDVMEMVLDAANAKDAAHVGVTYADANEKLMAIEAEAQDAEIQAIRSNLENVRQLAEQGKLDELPGAANALKSSFVKVYLKRG